MKHFRRLFLMLTLATCLGAAGAIAWAYLSAHGVGSASAGVASLSAPTGVTVPASTTGSTVHVAWNGVTAPDGSSVAYWVRRYAGSTPTDACGSSHASPIASGTGAKSCDDTGVTSGTYTYTVTTVFRSWTATSAASGSTVVNNDATAPDFGSPALTITPSGSFTFVSGTTVYYNPQASHSGSFTVAAAHVTDPESGVAKVNFPALAAITGGGGDTTSPYLGSYAWTATSTASGSQAVTAYNGAGLTSTSNFTVTPDTAAPTAGSVTANGAATFSSTGTIALSTVNFSDAASGVAGATLTRSAGTLTNGVCGALSGSTAVTISGGNDSSTLAAGCYQYTLTATDNVGNQATAQSIVVKVDKTAPTGGSITANGSASFNTSGTVSLSTTNFSDTGSGIATNAITRASGLLSGNACSALTGASAVTITLGNDSSILPTGCYQYTLTGTDNAGNQASALSGIVKVDPIAPSAAVTFPASGGLYNTATWNAGATSSITGTASDAETGLSTVTMSVQRASTGLCWTGSANTFTAACPNFVSVTGTTSWTKSFAAATSFPADGTYSVTTRATDVAGNVFTTTPTSFSFDTTAPTVSDVTSTLANGAYKTGTVVPVTVTFTEPVTVTGTPQLTLSTGSPATTAVNYTSGSGTTVLTFNYTVAAGNTSADLDYASTTALALNGGTIKDAATNPATLTLAAPAATHSLGANKNLVIDTTAPTVSDVTSTLANGAYKAGTVVPVTVTFTEPVTVTGTPTLTLSTGSPATTAVNYSSGSGTTVLTFNYTVAAGNTSADLDYASTSALALNGGSITDAATNSATLTLAAPAATHSLGANKNLVIDTTAPTVTDVTSTLANGAYKAGTVVPVTVTFTEPVTVTGTPTLTLSTGSPATTAVNYTSGSGTTVLTFNYTVAAGNTSADLDYASTTALALNGGTITDAATNPATLTLAAPAATHSLGANKNLVIDTTAPTPTITSISSGGGASKVNVAGTGTTGDSVTVYLCHATPCTSTNAVATLNDTVAGGTWSVGSGNIGGGTYFATAVETDAAGNTPGTAADFGPFVR